MNLLFQFVCSLYCDGLFEEGVVTIFFRCFAMFVMNKFGGICMTFYNG